MNKPDSTRLLKEVSGKEKSRNPGTSHHLSNHLCNFSSSSFSVTKGVGEGNGRREESKEEKGRRQMVVGWLYVREKERE